MLAGFDGVFFHVFNEITKGKHKANRLLFIMTKSIIGNKVHTISICHTASKYTKLSGLHFQKGKKKTPKDIYIIGLATT